MPCLLELTLSPEHPAIRPGPCLVSKEWKEPAAIYSFLTDIFVL